MIMSNNSSPRHPGENRGPSLAQEGRWIPASAGMTKRYRMTKNKNSDERTEFKPRSHWSPEARAKAAARARVARPWKHSTGPRTVLGKAASSQNARKHGYRSAEIARLHAVLRLQRLFVRRVAERHLCVNQLKQSEKSTGSGFFCLDYEKSFILPSMSRLRDCP